LQVAHLDRLNWQVWFDNCHAALMHPAGLSRGGRTGEDSRYVNSLWLDLRASEELTPKSIRDEIIWSHYVSLDQHLGYFIIVAYTFEESSSFTYLPGLLRVPPFVHLDTNKLLERQELHSVV
jgi:hypothetical protein